MKKVVAIFLSFLLGGAGGFVGGMYLREKKDEAAIVREVEACLSRLGLSQKEIDSSLIRPSTQEGENLAIVGGEFVPFSASNATVEVDREKAKGTVEIVNNSGYDVTAVDMYIDATIYETLKRKEKKATILVKGRINLKSGTSGICKFTNVKLPDRAVDISFDDITILSFTGKVDNKSQPIYVDYANKTVTPGELPEELTPEIVNAD